MGGKRCAGLGALLLPIALFGALPAAQSQASPPADTKPSPAIIVLDASRSMWSKVGGGSKMTLVRGGLTQALSTYQNSIAFGLVAFGQRASSSCTTQLLASPGELTSNTQGKLQFGTIKPAVQKPIAAALGQAAKGATADGGSLDIVLITDGLDSCKADACATAKSLKQGLPGLRIHVIGFDPKAKGSLKGLTCIAKVTGGQFLTARNASELKQSLTGILDTVAKLSAPAAPSEAAATPPPVPSPGAPAAAQAPPVPSPGAPAAAQAPPPPATVAAPPAPSATAPIAAAPPPAAPTAAAPPPAAQAEAAPPSDDASEPSGGKPQTPSQAALTQSASSQALPKPSPPSPTAQAQIAPAQGLPEQGAARQSAQAKGNLPQGDAPPGQQVQGQTDMPKSAAVSPSLVRPPPMPGPGTPPQSQPAAPPGPSLPVPVTFKALLTEAGPKLQAGIIWRVFSPEVGPNGTRKLISTHREAMPTAALLPGEYLVNAAYGLSNLTKKIKVESGRYLEETFVLNTGGLKLAAVQANGDALPQTSVRFDILSDEEDQFGNRHKILGDAKPGVVIRLNAGAYHIVSTYGHTNATVRADVTVEPGKVTEATVKHAAAPVTLKLVQSSGGEALADTKWSILTTTGDVVKELAGALPTLILAAGDYAVVANHNGESYTTKFKVTPGEVKQVEVVMEQGPISPEALQALTNPPPPPAPADATAASPVLPVSPGTGLGFGDSATPREPGILSNPGALLRPRLP